MKNLFSIGEVSKIKEVTIKALRYYHKVGILMPKYIDEETGYRYYSINQFIYIDIIKGFRALGTSIAELQEIFEERNTDKLLEFLQLKRYEAQENIKRMSEIIRNIDELSNSIEYSKDIINNDEISTQFFNERYVITVPCKEVESLKELLYYSELEKLIENKNVEMSLDRGIIYNVDSEGNIEPSYVFSGFKENDYVNIKDDITVLPKGEYLTLVYSKENEDERREKLFNYIKENNLKVKLFIEVELFNDFFNIESYNCQIQVFVESNEKL